MIGFVMVGTNNLDKATKFYDTLLGTIELQRVVTKEKYAGYALNKKPDDVEFYVTNPVNKEMATFGNGTMVTFLAETRESVNKFHKIALENGAINEGLPGEREDGNYYAYVRDPNGNKISATCISGPKMDL